MIRTVAICLLFVAGCGSQPAATASKQQPFVYDAFAPGGNGTGLTPQQITFNKAFEGRRAVCVEEIGQRYNLSSVRAVNFCDCQQEVFARGMTDAEMKATEDATFGSKSEASAKVMYAAVSRLLPTRQAV